MFKSLIQSRPRHDSKVILLQNVFSSSSHVYTGIAMLEQFLISSNMLHNMRLKNLIDISGSCQTIVYGLSGPIFWRKKKPTGQVKTFWINQNHPIIWFLAFPRSLLLQHNRHNTVLLACAILYFYYQRSKWNNWFRQRRRCSLFIDDANSVDL